MRPTRLRHAFVLLVVGFWCFAGATASLAQEEAPGEIELPLVPVIVNLENAAVAIVLSDDAEPMLRWWRARSEDPGRAELEAYDDGGAIAVERPPATDDDSPDARLRVEIAVHTLQALTVHGSNLELVIDRIREEPQPSPDPAAPTQDRGQPTALDLQLTDSDIELNRVGPVAATFTDSDTVILDTTGKHELSALGGRLRSVGHHGKLFVRGDSAEISAERCWGQTTINAFGGGVELRSLNSKFQLELTDAGLQVFGGSGSGTITASHTSADLRDTRFKSVNLKTLMSHFTLSAAHGKLTLDLTGGSLVADDCVGDVQGNTRDSAQVEIGEHKGKVTLNLQRDSSGDFRGIDGELAVTAGRADLSIDRAASLVLSVDESWVTANAIDKLTSFQATRSEVDLDLSESSATKIELAVQADSQVRVTLRTPCQVHAQGMASALASQVDVTGCELKLGRGGRSATRRVRGLEGEKPVSLTARVAQSAELTVEGR